MKKIILLFMIALVYSCKKDNCKVCTEYTIVETQYPYQHPQDIKTSSYASTLCDDSAIIKAEEEKADTTEGRDPDFPYIKTTVITKRKSSCK